MDGVLGQCSQLKRDFVLGEDTNKLDFTAVQAVTASIVSNQSPRRKIYHEIYINVY